MTILKTFSDTVKQYPSKVAVMYSGGEFTFQEVDVMSNFIAKQLLLNSDEETVPFYIEKNKYVLPVVLGIMKSGKIPLLKQEFSPDFYTIIILYYQVHLGFHI